MTRRRLDAADADVDHHVAEIAARVTDRQAEVVSAVVSLIQDEIEELRSDALIDLLHAGAEGNVATVVQAMRCGFAVDRVEAPTAALEHARRLAQQGVPVNALVRAYRLAQRRMTELVFAEMRTIDMAPHVRIRVVEEITQTLFSYIDRVSEQVVAVYEDEREQWLESHNRLRELRIREILDPTRPVDVDTATTSIRYPLRRHHVALVMSYPGGDGPSRRSRRSSAAGGGIGNRGRCLVRAALQRRGRAQRVGMAALPSVTDRSCGGGSAVSAAAT